jgi:hypothetical protein
MKNMKKIVKPTPKKTDGKSIIVEQPILKAPARSTPTGPPTRTSTVQCNDGGCIGTSTVYGTSALPQKDEVTLDLGTPVPPTGFRLKNKKLYLIYDTYLDYDTLQNWFLDNFNLSMVVYSILFMTNEQNEVQETHLLVEFDDFLIASKASALDIPIDKDTNLRPLIFRMSTAALWARALSYHSTFPSDVRETNIIISPPKSYVLKKK